MALLDKLFGKKNSKTERIASHVNSGVTTPEAGVVASHKNLPEIMELQKRLDVLVTLNIILLSEKDSWLRLHSRIADPGGQLGIYKIDNGAGDTMFIVFSNAGCIIKGFDHESALSPYARDEFAVCPGIYDEVPADLLRLLDDPMIEKQDVTFCFWREAEDSGWRKGNIINSDNLDDGHNFLLRLLFPSASDFIKWAKDYFERELPVQPIEAVYAGVKVNDDIISGINPERDSRAALAEIMTGKPCLK